MQRYVIASHTHAARRENHNDNRITLVTAALLETGPLPCPVTARPARSLACCREASDITPPPLPEERRFRVARLTTPFALGSGAGAGLFNFRPLLNRLRSGAPVLSDVSSQERNTTSASGVAGDTNAADVEASAAIFRFGIGLSCTNSDSTRGCLKVYCTQSCPGD